MQKNTFIQNRYDFFLIWGHGLKYKDNIIGILAKEKKFEILYIVKHKVNNMKSFIKKIYKYDYVPYFHLKNKTKYLINTQHEVMFIFLINKDPQEIWKLGHGRGHIESHLIINKKNIIRKLFNERRNNKLTENHVVHASDNEVQVHHALKLLGYQKGLHFFETHKKKPFKVPHFLDLFDNYKIHEINTNEMVCNTIINNKILTIPISESPQYKFLLGYEKEYQEYIEKYQGTKLKSYYDLIKYKNMLSNFTYLSKKFEGSYVIVKKVNNSFLILDGLHRASIVKYQNNKKIVVAEIL